MNRAFSDLRPHGSAASGLHIRKAKLPCKDAVLRDLLDLLRLGHHRCGLASLTSRQLKDCFFPMALGLLNTPPLQR